MSSKASNQATLSASPPEGGKVGPHLAFTDCTYTVTVSKDGKPTTPLSRALSSSNKPKRLLRGVTAEVKAGHVLAILGTPPFGDAAKRVQ